MLVLLVVLTFIAICIVTARITRLIVVWVAKRNGFTGNTMPMKYHCWAIGIYFVVIDIALFLLMLIP